MKISPYTGYLELQPNALLVRQIFYYLQKVGVTRTESVAILVLIISTMRSSNAYPLTAFTS
jgi:hypothetical protein